MNRDDLTDEDGIDGPFDRAMEAAMRDDRLAEAKRTLRGIKAAMEQSLRRATPPLVPPAPYYVDDIMNTTRAPLAEVPGGPSPATDVYQCREGRHFWLTEVAAACCAFCGREP